MKRLRFLACFLCLSSGIQAQTVSGYWYGSAFITGTAGTEHNYLVELILDDNGRSVQGVLNYYFRNLYRSIPVKGRFDRQQQQLVIDPTPMLYYGSLTNLEVDCQMTGAFKLVSARAGSTLSGVWKPDEQYKYTCPPIQVRLSLDREQTMNDSAINAIRTWKEEYQVWTPPQDESAQAGLAVTPRTVKNYLAVQQQETRDKEVTEEFELDADSVRISLYDNGEVDGDSISVFLNKKIITTHQRLSTRPIRFTIPLDSLEEYVELIMFAENLGSIPPNTALMIVEAGTKTYQIRITSTLEKSGSVRLKRKRKGLKVR